MIEDDFSIDEKVQHIETLRLHIQTDTSGRQPYDKLFDLSTAYVHYWEGEYDEAERLAEPLKRDEFLLKSCGFMFDEIKSRGTMFP